MEIVRATPADASTLVRLENTCFAQPWTPATLADALGDERYVILLARDGGSTFGYALGWNIEQEAELARVGVLPESRGQGIGKLLTSAALHYFKSCAVEVVFLEVREYNLSARRLYEKCGFVEVGKRPHYYADGENAIVMRAEIS